MTTLQFGGQTLQLNLGENTRAAQRAAVASEEAAALASRFANDDTDTDVVGGAPGDRGAKYYALKAQADGAAQVVLASGHRVRAGNGVPFLTWAALAAATGMAAGDKATVLAADAGTHTDPVVGGTVNNAGVYTYSSSPAGWQRTGNLDSQTATTALAAVKQLVEITLQNDTIVPSGAWYAEFFLPVATTFTSWKAWVFLGTGTADIRLLVDEVDVYGPRTVGTTTDTAAPSIAIAAGARVAFQIDNITGTPKGIAVQLLGLPT